MFRTIGSKPTQQRTLAFALPPPHPLAHTNETTRTVIRFLDDIAERTERGTRLLIAVPSPTDLFHMELHVRTAGLSTPLVPAVDTDDGSFTRPRTLKSTSIPHTIWHCDHEGAVYDFTLHDFDLTQAARLIEFARRQTNDELVAAVMSHEDWGKRHLCSFASPETMALDFLQRVRKRRQRWRRWIREWVVTARFLRRAKPRARLLYRRALAPGGRLARAAQRRFFNEAHRQILQ